MSAEINRKTYPSTISWPRSRESQWWNTVADSVETFQDSEE